MMRVMVCAVAALLMVSSLFAAQPDVEKPGIGFPEVDGWVRGKRWDNATRQGGASLEYKTKEKLANDYLGVQVRVYYPAGGAAPNDLKDDAVAKELARLGEALVNSPIDKDVKAVGKAQTIKLGKGADAPEMLYIQYTGKRGRDPREMRIYLGVRQGHFVHLQTNSFPETHKKAETLIDALLAAMGQAMTTWGG